MFKRKGHIHLIGVGGIGMSGLARCLIFEGWSVSGSDANDGPQVRQLRKEGVTVFAGHDGKNVPPDSTLVVYSAAIDEQNPERISARRQAIPQLKYAEMLGRMMALKYGIAVAGTHGKTTTAGLTSFALSEAGLAPSFIVGGIIPQLGGNARGAVGSCFIMEACEYDRSFLNLLPEIAVITNIDADHLDYYEDLDEIEDAFLQFADRVRSTGIVIGCGDDPRVRSVLDRTKSNTWSYGFSKGVDFRATDLELVDGRWTFRVVGPSGDIGEFKLPLAGKHNILNALSVIAISEYLEVDQPDVARAIGEFEGVKRRFQVKGEVNGVTVIDDYAHHPTEIRAVIAAARDRYPSRPIWCIFQPHQYSRTRHLFDDFVGAFAGAERILLAEIFGARDSEEDREAVSSRDLVKVLNDEGFDARFANDFDALSDVVINEAEPGTVVLTLGAGDIWKVGESILPGSKDEAA